MHSQHATQHATSSIMHSHMSQSLKRKNLHTTWLESKLFFTGDKPNLAQITRGKDILSLEFN